MDAPVLALGLVVCLFESGSTRESRRTRLIVSISHLCIPGVAGETPSPTVAPTPFQLYPETPTPAPVDQTSISAPLALGCYEDVGTDRIMEERVLVDPSMTTEVI